MAEEKGPCFVLTLGLKYNKPIERCFDNMFRMGNRLYNALVAEKKQALENLEKSDEWIANEEERKALIKIEQKEKRSLTKEEKKSLSAVYKKRDKMLIEAGFHQNAFGNDIKKYRSQFGWVGGANGDRIYSNVFNSQVCKKIGRDQVWAKFDKYFKGTGKTIKFRRLKDCRSLSCSTNEQGFKFDGTSIVLTSRGRQSLKDPKARKKRKKNHDTNNKLLEDGKGDYHFGSFAIPVVFTGSQYEQEALKDWEDKLSFCTLVRIPWKKGWLYKLQLTLKGNPPVIKNKQGKPKHELGKGKVGIDIGPRTIAVVSDEKVELLELAKSADNPERKLADIKQRIDTSRRMSNPEMFTEDGQIKRGDILAKEHPECVKVIERSDGSKRYIRLWKESKNYKRLLQRERFLYAKCTRIRQHEHKELANKILAMGDEFYIEPMNWQELAKKDEKKENFKGMRKSIGNRAPGFFMTTLEKKVTAKGGTFERVDSFSCKASQYNHIDKTYNKPELDERIKRIGVHSVQRDLYSAFLLQNVNGYLDDYNQNDLEAKFDGFLKLHDEVMNNLPEYVPSSMGKEDWLKGQ